MCLYLHPEYGFNSALNHPLWLPMQGNESGRRGGETSSHFRSHADGRVTVIYAGPSREAFVPALVTRSCSKVAPGQGKQSGLQIALTSSR